MKVRHFSVFDPVTGHIVRDITASVSRRTIDDANALVMTVAEKLGWTGASVTDVVREGGRLSLSAIYPGGNGYRIIAA